MTTGKIVRVTFAIDASDPAGEESLEQGLAILIDFGKALAEHGHKNLVQVEIMGGGEAPKAAEEKRRAPADPSLN